MQLLFPKITIAIFLAFTMMACSQDSYTTHKIANIDEASGISYCEDSNTLIVANDEGSFYEINTTGEPIARYKLGDYDLEGVVCEKEQLFFAVEKGVLLLVNRQSLQTQELKLKGKGFDLSKKSGIEGIAKVGELYYLAIQSKDKKDAKLLIVKAGANFAKVTDTIHHNIIDSAGLHYADDQLYIVSDTKNRLYVYDLKKEEIKKEINLTDFDQEGITFDNDGNVYLADDKGAVLKYNKEELGL
ncbi:MAG: SdiA-regulated domain-containing protein [Campylobacterales bacterium]|nr:SdiA-regulated domain-containing protein [Campylobacterales bacterium]